MASEQISYLLTVDEAADLLKVQPRTIRLWIHDGTLKAYRVRDKNKPEVEANEAQTKLWITRESLAEKAKVKWKLS